MSRHSCRFAGSFGPLSDSIAAIRADSENPWHGCLLTCCSPSGEICGQSENFQCIDSHFVLARLGLNYFIEDIEPALNFSQRVKRRDLRKGNANDLADSAYITVLLLFRIKINYQINCHIFRRVHSQHN